MIATARSVVMIMAPPAMPRRTASKDVGETAISSRVPFPRSQLNWVPIVQRTFCQKASMPPPMTTNPRYWRGAWRPW